MLQPPRQSLIGGAGPGGLAAADMLRKAGIQVTVYDRSDRAGGLLMYGIPGFKLEKDVVMRRNEQLELGGVEFVLNCDVDADIFATIQAMDRKMAVLALDNSQQVRAAKAVGMLLIREAYADRAYTADGLLVPRSQEGAVIHDVDAVIARCLRLAKAGELVAIDGTVMKSAARSICLHGDTPGAVEMARELRDALAGEGIAIAASAPEPPED